MTKQDLKTLIGLAEVARKTGEISFEAMPAVAEAVQRATQAYNNMQEGDLLLPHRVTQPTPDAGAKDEVAPDGEQPSGK